MLPLGTTATGSKMPSESATLPATNGVTIPPKPMVSQSMADSGVGVSVPESTIASKRLIKTS